MEPFRTGSIVSSEVSWFRVSGKDFLVVSDENSVYFLDRTGNKRLTLKEPVTKAPGSAMRLTSGRILPLFVVHPEEQCNTFILTGRLRNSLPVILPPAIPSIFLM